MKRLGSTAIVLIALLLLAGAPRQLAHADVRASVAPSLIALEEPVDGGDEIRLPSLRVINRGDEAGSFRVRASHVSEQANLAPEADWIRLDPEEFTLEPEAVQLVSVRLRVPGGAPEGQYEALLIVAPVAGGGSTGGGVGITAAVATTVRYMVEHRNEPFYQPAVDWFQDRAPFSYAGIALLVALGLGQYGRRRFRFVIGVERRDGDG